jgi:redox-sensitive bicupin YhaK (pirin superfamily)
MLEPSVEITPSRVATVGGAAVRRALPVRAHRTIGAWCFLDHFGPTAVTPTTATMVGPHPHMGLQTVTWLLEGELVHSDSLGTEQPIRPGQLNLMSAGHGVAHAEDGRDRAAPSIHGVQLWVAQPEITRHGAAAFEHHDDLPRLELGRGTATVMVGSLDGARSPARYDTPLLGADLALHGPVELPLDPGFEHGLAVISGHVIVDGVRVNGDHLAYLGGARSSLALDTSEPTRALLLGGVPFESAVLMWWNFVARSRAEVERAYHDWETGTERFGSVRATLPRIDAPRPEWLH